MAKRKEGCIHPDCIYRADTQYYGHSCDYMIKTGKSRIAGLNPEDAKPCNCKVYVPDPKKKARKRNREKKIQQWHIDARRLNGMGLTNEEIANRLGNTADSVGKYLRRSGIKANRKISLNGWDWDKAMELYVSCGTDNKIAVEIGCSISTVRRWREKNGLSPNGLRQMED